MTTATIAPATRAKGRIAATRLLNTIWADIMRNRAGMLPTVAERNEMVRFIMMMMLKDCSHMEGEQYYRGWRGAFMRRLNAVNAMTLAPR